MSISCVRLPMKPHQREICGVEVLPYDYGKMLAEIKIGDRSNFPILFLIR